MSLPMASSGPEANATVTLLMTKSQAAMVCAALELVIDWHSADDDVIADWTAVADTLFPHIPKAPRES